MQNNKPTLAIDIGGSSVKSALVSFTNGKLQLTNKKRTELKKFDIEELNNIVKSLVAENDIVNVGISTCGPVTYSGLLRKSGNIDGYINHNWQEVLGKEVCVKVHNDAQCAALGVFHADDTIKTNSLVHIVIGTGMAGSAILDGKIWRGHSGFAGHYGHMRTAYKGKEYQVQELLSTKGIEFFTEQNINKKLSLR